MEAGIELFGNNGDSTIENAIYWNIDKKSSFYNSGWMIWGNIDKLNDEYIWDPSGNDEIPEDDLEYINENFDTYTESQLLELKKDIILEDPMAIRIHLKELGIRNCV